MPSDLKTSMFVAASGMRAQGARIRTISENVANANSGPEKPDGEPYRRRLVTFKNVFDRALEADLVKVSRVKEDKSRFRLHYDPNHPAANENGYVKMPNVNSLIEMVDMREAQRSYQANLNMVDSSRSMIMATIDLLR